jgi:hypothetical protein
MYFDFFVVIISVSGVLSDLGAPISNSASPSTFASTFAAAASPTCATKFYQQAIHHPKNSTKSTKRTTSISYQDEISSSESGTGTFPQQYQLDITLAPAVQFYLLKAANLLSRSQTFASVLSCVRAKPAS